MIMLVLIIDDLFAYSNLFVAASLMAIVYITWNIKDVCLLSRLSIKMKPIKSNFAAFKSSAIFIDLLDSSVLRVFNVEVNVWCYYTGYTALFQIQQMQISAIDSAWTKTFPQWKKRIFYVLCTTAGLMHGGHASHLLKYSSILYL